MGTYISDDVYQQAMQEYYAKNSCTTTSSTSTSTSNSIYDDAGTSTSSAVSSGDDSTDGHIGFFKAAKCVLWDGVVKKFGGGIIKSVIQHPIKSALMVGACFIPVIGPVIGAGLAAYGLYQGGKQVVQGIQTINQIQDIAEAQGGIEGADEMVEEAFSDVGAGAGTVALSAVGLKGSANALAKQLSGESTTVNAIREIKARGEGNYTTGELFETAVREGASETLTNASEAVTNAANKVSEAYHNIKDQGLTNYALNKASGAIDKISGTAKKVGDTIDNIKTRGSKGSASAADDAATSNSFTAADKTALKNQIREQYNLDADAEITLHNNGTVTFKKDGYNYTVESAKKGYTVTKKSTNSNAISSEETTHYNSEGQTVKVEEVTTYGRGESATTTSTQKRYSYNHDGELTGNSSETTQAKADGTVTSEGKVSNSNGVTKNSNTTYNNGSRKGTTVTEASNANTGSEYYSFETPKEGLGYKTTSEYTLRGYELGQKAGLLERLLAKIDSSQAGNLISAKLPVSDGFLSLTSNLRSSDYLFDE